MPAYPAIVGGGSSCSAPPQPGAGLAAGLIADAAPADAPTVVR
jgi:hypothetical protein